MENDPEELQVSKCDKEFLENRPILAYALVAVETSGLIVSDSLAVSDIIH